MALSQDKVRVNVAFTKEQLERLDALRAESGLSRSAIVALAVSEWLAEKERDGK